MRREETSSAHTRMRVWGTCQTSPTRTAGVLPLSSPDFLHCGLPFSLTLPLVGEILMQMKSGEPSGQTAAPTEQWPASAPARVG